MCPVRVFWIFAATQIHQVAFVMAGDFFIIVAVTLDMFGVIT